MSWLFRKCGSLDVSQTPWISTACYSDSFTFTFYGATSTDYHEKSLLTPVIHTRTLHNLVLCQPFDTTWIRERRQAFPSAYPEVCTLHVSSEWAGIAQLIAKGYGLGGRGFRVQFSVQARDFSLLRSVQAVSDAHSAFCSMGTGGSIPGVKRQGREADHLPPSIAEVKNCGTIFHYPVLLHGAVIN
jgi:hypothetical protein